MSSPSDSEMAKASYARDDASGTTSGSLDEVSPMSLPSPINHPTPPHDNLLHEPNSLSPGNENPKQTPVFVNASALSLYHFHLSAPSPWDRQCECGGISPHYHSRGGLHDMMNGTHSSHPPTGPRVEAATTSITAPTSPATASPSTATQTKRPGRLTNHVQVAKTYVFEQEIQRCLKENGVSQAREDNIRLAGVQWIDNVRRALKLPVRTFNTAVVYYHKFRLQHSDGEYSFVDASAAALFAACKIEDTLKKSRDILCAAHNLKASRNEQLSPDDQVFEQPSRTVIGLERLMLEASAFDFRNRHPQEFLIKLLKHYSYPKTSAVVKLAYQISLDLYRTWTPLKQTTATMAFTCLELAGRLLGEEHEVIWRGTDYARWGIERGMVMESLLDLLELYTHHRSQSVISPEFPVERFLEVRIPLNQESMQHKIPRFTAWVEKEGHDVNGINGTNGAKNMVVSPRDAVASPRRASANNANPNVLSGGGAGNPGGPASGMVVGVRQRVGERGREGTVRFILNPDRQRDEKAIIELFSKP